MIQKTPPILKIGILSFKVDKARKIQSLLGTNNPKVLIKIVKIYKDQGDFNDLLKENFDVVIIAHKIELRTFLLGRNGLYNKLVDCIYQALSNSV